MEYSLIIFLVVVAISIYRGYRSGVAVIISRILSLALAYAAAFLFAEKLGDWIQTISPLKGLLSYFAAGMILFVGASLVFSSLFSLVTKKFFSSKEGVSKGSAVGGAILGGTLGCVVGIIAVWFFSTFYGLIQLKSNKPVKEPTAFEKVAQDITGGALEKIAEQGLGDSELSGGAVKLLSDPGKNIKHYKQLANSGELSRFFNSPRVRKALESRSPATLYNTPEFKSLTNNDDFQQLASMLNLSEDPVESNQKLATQVTKIWAQVQQLQTNPEYRPDDADEEVDIRIRYPLDTRNIQQLDNLRISTNQGLIPVGNFVERVAAQKVDTIRRIEGKRANRITADMSPGANFAAKLEELQAALPEMNIDPRVEFSFRGQQEQQQNSQNFLQNAFMIALAVIFIILVAQFNSLYQSFLILTAILFSTAGVFIGLLIMNQPFGIVMSGIGVISLAGIVVNNNIVLIDTYNYLRKQGLPVQEAILRTGAQRLRPVMLTTVTTILGLMPMVLQVNIDILGRDVSYGAPSTEWWVQLSSAVAGGLAFSTLLTLIVTPSMLMIGHKTSEYFKRKFAYLNDKKDLTTETKLAP